jgi:FkbM family methyltransferase
VEIHGNYNITEAPMKRLQLLFYLFRKYRNWWYLFDQLSHNRKPQCITLRNGLIFDGPEDSSLVEIAHEIFLSHDYSPSGFAIGSEDYIVDIGANVGMYSIFAAIKTNKVVYAYEPFPKNMEYFKRNIRQNRIKNITPNPCAISNIRGRSKLYLTEGSAGNQLFEQNLKGKIIGNIEIQTITLGDIFIENNIATIDLLKLDCEGAEGLIIPSTHEEYFHRIKRIVLEFHDHLSPLRHGELLSALEKYGFKCTLHWNGVSPVGYIYGTSIP